MVALPTSGGAEVAAEKVFSNNLKLQAKIGLLPDVPAFYDWMTGTEFMQYVGELHGLPSGENKQRTESLLKMVELKKSAPSCPKCGANMKLMRPRPADSWNAFWGCTQYSATGCKGSERYFETI